MLVVLTAAASTDLTTVDHVKQQLQIAGTAEDAELEAFISTASAAIVDFCRRPFAREQYQETLGGTWSQTLMLSRTPILRTPLPTVFRGEPGDTSDPVIDFGVENPEAGFLRRQIGWFGSNWPPGGQYGVRPMTSFGLGQIDTSIRFTTNYWAGYVLPGSEKSGVITAATQASPCLITSVGHGLTSGQTVLIQGVVGMVDLNDRTYTVTVIDADHFTIGVNATGFAAYLSGGTWALEPGTAVQGIPLPGSIEQAAIDSVKAWRAARRRDPRITSKRIGNLAYTFHLGEKEPYPQLPPNVIGLLAPYRRVTN